MIALADAIEADVLRIRHEFQQLPGLVLTVADAAHLYSVSTAHAKRLLDELALEGFVIGVAAGGYRRSTPPTCD
jgi:hypothetical protein